MFTFMDQPHSQTATNPLERIKMLSQTGEHGVKSAGKEASVSIMDMYRQIIQKVSWQTNGVPKRCTRYSLGYFGA